MESRLRSRQAGFSEFGMGDGFWDEISNNLVCWVRDVSGSARSVHGWDGWASWTRTFSGRPWLKAHCSRMGSSRQVAPVSPMDAEFTQNLQNYRIPGGFLGRS